MSELSIPGFEVIEKLGEGGMAVVFKARQLSLDRIVAIKILSSRLASDPSDVQRFQTEAQSAAKLKHQGIVQVYDANAQGGLFYFVMEFVDGYTIGDWVRRKGALSEHEALLVVECVTDALDYAWTSAGIIHCDIKPDNIMVDADGTVKVADLGLARTISTIKPEDFSDEVTGTPCYMSPEQSRGEGVLDCRTDIYSLGAMLFHIVTGKMLFEGHADEDIMDMQITDRVEDAMDINPDLSHEICWLMERMLVKDRQDRYTNWEEVRTDLQRVKKKRMSKLGPPPVGLSTMGRSENRTERDFVPKTVLVPSTGMSPVKKTVVWLVIAIVVFGSLGLILNSTKNQPVKRPPRPLYKQPTANTAQKRPEENKAAEMYEFAKKWATDNPGNYIDAIERFQKVAGQTKGTKYALMAEDQVEKLKKELKGKVKALVESLHAKADVSMQDEDYDVAINLFSKYEGPLRKESFIERSEAAKELRKQRDEAVEKKKYMEMLAKETWSNLLTQLAEKLVAEGVNSARVVLEQSMSAAELSGMADELAQLKKVLDDASNIDERILNSFEDDRGRTVRLYLTSGTKNVVISRVVGDTIKANQQMKTGNSVANIEVRFKISDLSIREKLSRMAPDDAYDVALVKGLIALEARAFPQAKKYFELTHPLLGERLLKRLGSSESTSLEQGAKDALDELLVYVDLSPGRYNEGELGDKLSDMKFPVMKITSVKDRVRRYREQYKEALFYSTAEPVLSLLETLEPPASRLSSLIKKKAEGFDGDVDVKDVLIEKLLDRNRHLAEDEIIITTDDLDRVVKVEIVSKNITDIKPLAGLENLKEFYCSPIVPGQIYYEKGFMYKDDDGEWQHEKVSFAHISDLTPLKGLPLKKVNICRTSVSDLGPLKYSPIEYLNINATKVQELRDVKDLELQVLETADNQIKDFKSIEKMPLIFLNVANTGFSETELLEDMPLRHLDMSNTRINDMQSLEGKKLETLNLRGCRLSKDKYDVLEGMPITDLILEAKILPELRQLYSTLKSLKRLNYRSIKDF